MGKIRQGPAREFLYGGMQLDPAEGSELTYNLSGRSGTVHMAGNGAVGPRAGIGGGAGGGGRAGAG